MLSKVSIPLVPAYVVWKMDVVFDISIIDKVKSSGVIVPWGSGNFIMRSCDNVIMRSCDDVIVFVIMQSCNQPTHVQYRK
jgi:hypothetical protein